MKIMLVEDDYVLNKTISMYLKSCGMNVESFLGGEDALKAISGKYDMFIFDIDIPEINGLELLEETRRLCPSAPIIMISATIELDMIIKAYNLGCSDYVKKPFDVKELELKILAMTQKRSEMIQLAGDLSYDKTSHKLFYGAEEIDLTKNESKLIHLLVANRGKLVGFDQISYAIWGNDDTPHIRQLVMRLSKKIPVKLIENRRDMGYFIK